MSEMAPYHEFFPEQAKRELAYLELDGHSYPMIEFYCIDPECDCRRVMVNVYADLTLQQPLAVITYGWDSLEFYQKWLPGVDPHEVKGPALELLTPSTELARRILQRFKDNLKPARLDATFAKHYHDIKSELKRRRKPPAPTALPLGRNAPCPCGSGKKAKKCCGTH